ncbi:MAG TPA: hypothetical protein VFI84_01785 [Candidatus Saccharimonadales bacterium]|nr:hypothetical protein [Candidatus Saccharimonadales bacterium]
MAETITSLPSEQGFTVTQTDWLTESQDLSHINCQATSLPLDVDIYFGDLKRNDEDLAPYYSLRWTTAISREVVIEIIRKTGQELGAEEYMCHGPHNMRGYSYPCDLAEEQQKELDKVVNEAMGESDDLDKVLGPEFGFLRVNTKHGALVWEGEGTFHYEDTGTELFGFISDEPIDNDLTQNIIRETIAAEDREAVVVALASLQKLYEKYGYAMPA